MLRFLLSISFSFPIPLGQFANTILMWLYQMTVIAKLKLKTTPSSWPPCGPPNWRTAMRLHFGGAYSFAHGKTSNSKRLQRETYADIRRQFGLPAQMACSVPRQVGATNKALWTKARKHAEARRRLHQEAVSGPGQSATLCLAHPHLRLRPWLLAQSRAARERGDPHRTHRRPLPGL
jgi:hypothetical protein